jgi:hypothetical protein
MAVYSELRSSSNSLAGAAVDTVTITGSAPFVFVHNRSAAVIWVRAGAAGATLSNPTVGGADCIPISGGAVIPVRDGGGGATVKLIGAGGEAYTVYGSVAVAADDKLIPGTDMGSASAISVLDTGNYFTGTNVETVLAELPNKFRRFNVRDYGATGDGTTDDTTAVQAAITAAATGGTVFFPNGTYKITSALVIAANADAVGSPTWQGGGIHLLGESSRWSVLKAIGGINLLDYTTNFSSFCSIDNLTLLGPGAATAGSVGIDAHTSPFFSARGLYIRDFAVGVQTYDCTGWSLDTCRISYCGIGAQFGYNADCYTFTNVDIRNCTTVCLLIGWQTGSYTGASQYTGQLSFIGCLFSYSPLGVLISDLNATGINFLGGYWEGNTKDMEIGVSGRGDTAGPHVLMSGTFHSATVSPPIAIGIDVFNRPNLRLVNCSTDGNNRYTVFVKMNDTNNTQVELVGCQVNAVTAALQIGSRNYNTTVSNRQSIRWMGAETQMFDFGIFPATPAKTTIAYNAGTDAVLERWGRNTTSDVIVNRMDLTNKVGNILVLQGTTAAYIAATSTAALPTAAAVYRGCFAYVAGGAGVADLIYWCRKNAADAYEWQVLA